MTIGSLQAIFQSAVWNICYLGVLIGLSAYGIHRWSIIALFLKNRRHPMRPAGRFETLPTVTVQLPVFNEYYVIRRLIESVSLLDYPKDRLQIQILDDSTDETREIAAAETARLQALGFDIEHLHRVDRSGFKAGALAAGMESAKGEYVFILDADFVPGPQVLRQTIDFFTDPGVGMVQTRWGHLNRNDSLLTRVQAMFLDGHHLLEQTARSRGGRFFNFNGTAGVWRRTTIEDAGGWHQDTLCEDLDLSYRAQLKGWTFVYLPDIIIPAELPPDINGFKSQQHRWAKGSVQTCKKLLPTVWRAKLPFFVKLEATMHLTSYFAYMLLGAMCVLVIPQALGSHHGLSYSLMVDLPIFLATMLSSIAFYLCLQRYLNPGGWLKDFVMLPMLLAVAVGMSVNNCRAVLEALLNHQSEFVRTPKYGVGRRARTTRRASYIPISSLLPFVEAACALYFGWSAWRFAVAGQWLTVPFILLFSVGFAYVGLKSMLLWLQRAALPAPAKAGVAVS